LAGQVRVGITFGTRNAEGMQLKELRKVVETVGTWVWRRHGAARMRHWAKGNE